MCLLSDGPENHLISIVPYTDTLQLERDAFFAVIFLIFTSKFAFHADFTCYFLILIFLTSVTVLAPT